MACPIVREPDGLAMSSRNMRLTADERRIAPAIHQLLLQMSEKAVAVPLDELILWGVDKIEKNPDLKVEYLEFADCETLLPVANLNRNTKTVLLAAIYLGEIRLIDNLELFL